MNIDSTDFGFANIASTRCRPKPDRFSKSGTIPPGRNWATTCRKSCRHDEPREIRSGFAKVKNKLLNTRELHHPPPETTKGTTEIAFEKAKTLIENSLQTYKVI